MLSYMILYCITMHHFAFYNIILPGVVLTAVRNGRVWESVPVPGTRDPHGLLQGPRSCPWRWLGEGEIAERRSFSSVFETGGACRWEDQSEGRPGPEVGDRLQLQGRKINRNQRRRPEFAHIQTGPALAAALQLRLFIRGETAFSIIALYWVCSARVTAGRCTCVPGSRGIGKGKAASTQPLETMCFCSKHLPSCVPYMRHSTISAFGVGKGKITCLSA